MSTSIRVYDRDYASDDPVRPSSGVEHLALFREAHRYAISFVLCDDAVGVALREARKTAGRALNDDEASAVVTKTTADIAAARGIEPSGVSEYDLLIHDSIRFRRDYMVWVEQLQKMVAVPDGKLDPIWRQMSDFIGTVYTIALVYPTNADIVIDRERFLSDARAGLYSLRVIEWPEKVHSTFAGTLWSTSNGTPWTLDWKIGAPENRKKPPLIRPIGPPLWRTDPEIQRAITLHAQKILVDAHCSAVRWTTEQLNAELARDRKRTKEGDDF